MELVPRFKCSLVASPEVPYTCFEQDFCGQQSTVNYWIDWENPMSLKNWSESIGLICRPGWQIGLLGSAAFGGWCSSLLWLPRFSDVYGRLRLFQLSCIVTTIMYVAIMFSKSYMVTLASIFMIGFFASLRVNVGWPYMLELIPKQSHSLHAMGLNAIAPFEAITGVLFFAYLSNSAYLLMGIFLVLQLITICLTFLLPESPVYLLTKGRLEEAEAALS